MIRNTRGAATNACHHGQSDYKSFKVIFMLQTVYDLLPGTAHWHQLYMQHKICKTVWTLVSAKIALPVDGTAHAYNQQLQR